MATVFFCAVGGSSLHRTSRKMLLDSCSVEGTNSVALSGSPYDSSPFPIPSWIPAVLPVDFDSREDALVSPSSSQFRDTDALLVIGHLHSKEFVELVKNFPRLQDEHIWIQGGFEDSFNIKLQVGHTHHSSQCPKYNLEDWAPTLALYPERLQVMRSFQWGGFFTTRQEVHIRDKEGVATDAFYRQFNLHQIVQENRVLEFETAVLREAGDHPKFRNTLAQMERDAQNVDTQTALFETVCNCYRDNGPWTDPSLVKVLTQSLMVVIPRFVPLVINEYDSYVAHLMLRKYAGFDLEQVDLTPQRHMDFIQACLGHGLPGESQRPLTVENDAYVQRLRSGFGCRTLLVLHDLGLDPMCDDWLAISLIRTVLS